MGLGVVQTDAGMCVDVVGELCGIYFLAAVISSVKSEARPLSGHEDGIKNCQSSERDRRWEIAE